ncbi:MULTISPECIES: helix-turn-helix domain-containing protein [Mameliella]|uniref:arsenate reductase/protein-tyrosine-phosphatase family protein n=1 Tax=Mameliella TaxID=1434019 RepID=UPI000B529A0B|nr:MULTISPECIES: helix-turn-helix domain-containing protein [Mameliella]MBV6637524.1 helix-turn-helix domain-containing protein [Mameliella sp.]MCR9275100.1 helix-turn-helix domain-containing protein [Paracoccaceae bacterium]MBY6122143.1 helix-turn-helix domain-containing protein [Mameliella alba]OWV39952.1 ArsR family transcriptional regulator [Mameliella alba]OWV56341.1 ArsR family transcriptional regulator [Mameliella alba]
MKSESLNALAALAHGRRLDVFRLLMRRFPDAVPAGEIALALDLAPSTLSAALSQLRSAGLVTQSRHGTSLMYAADTEGAGRLLTYLWADCCRGRPDLCLPTSLTEREMADRTYNVLFICTGNSARSIFAETLLRDLAGGRFRAFSAGTNPYSELNPQALQVLQDKGHDVSDLRAKNVSEFQGEGAPQLDFVFTVCDRAANEECPPWPGQPMTGHWGQPDPVKATGTEAERHLAFQQVYGALKNRIQAFTALPIGTLDRESLQARIDDIARTEDFA